MVHDIDDEIEIDGYGYWESLHDTDIQVASRDDNCRQANRQLFCTILSEQRQGDYRSTDQRQ